MHHFRGRLLEGDETRLDPANVYIQFHHASAMGPAAGWNGYLLVETEEAVEPGETYTLSLVDGRSGSLWVDHLVPDEDGKLRAIFNGEGPLQ
jgi:hypothetical protein